jgi:hypothetical protein
MDRLMFATFVLAGINCTIVGVWVVLIIRERILARREQKWIDNYNDLTVVEWPEHVESDFAPGGIYYVGGSQSYADYVEGYPEKAMSRREKYYRTGE